MIHVADCAYPTDWHDLPHDVQVVLGYVGAVEGTPHVWTAAEVASVHKVGRVWAPIWTPPQAGFGPEAGRRAAAGMLAQLVMRKYPKAGPVFLDIERSTWVAGPGTVSAGIEAWKRGMRAGGWSQAYAYVPAAAQFDWVADWVNTPPVHLAPGVVGVQYAGEVLGGRYDLSVFNPAVFAGILNPPKVDPVTLTAADQKWLTDHLATPLHDMRLALGRIYTDNDPANARPFALRHLSAKLDQLALDVAKPRPVTVDPKALATELAAVLGPDLGTQLVHHLAAQLGK